MLNRLVALARDGKNRIKAKRIEGRIRSELVSDLTGAVATLRTRVDELENELDELRSDSRRIAELKILVEDTLAEVHAKNK